RVLDAGRLAGGVLARIGLRARTDVQEIAHGHATLSDAQARAAFVHTLRAVVEPSGQRVDASNRLHLSAHIPFLLVWGEHDSIIPMSHGEAAHENVPGSRLELFPRSGHFPQLDEPARFVDVLVDFLESTDPAPTLDPGRWRELLEPR
ncbi:MAG: alpha/beta hydrolase fold protein, partial [Solirubrobacterales bacterium]|nr:alpha/beta hydrolase fold protein [Solirubrobacterales bacterium]